MTSNRRATRALAKMYETMLRIASSLQECAASARPASVTQNGAPGVFALSYQAQGTTSLPTFLGAQLDGETMVNARPLKGWFRAAWVHEFLPDRGVTAGFTVLPGSTFSVDGARAASNAALTIGAGATIQGAGQIGLNDSELGAERPGLVLQRIVNGALACQCVARLGKTGFNSRPTVGFGAQAFLQVGDKIAQSGGLIALDRRRVLSQKPPQRMA